MTLTILYYMKNHFNSFKKSGFSTEINISTDLFGKKNIIFNIFDGNTKITTISKKIVNSIENEFLINEDFLFYINYRIYKNRLIYTLTINKDNKQLFSEKAKYILNDNWGNPVIEIS